MTKCKSDPRPCKQEKNPHTHQNVSLKKCSMEKTAGGNLHKIKSKFQYSPHAKNQLNVICEVVIGIGLFTLLACNHTMHFTMFFLEKIVRCNVLWGENFMPFSGFQEICFLLLITGCGEMLISILKSKCIKSHVRAISLSHTPKFP